MDVLSTIEKSILKPPPGKIGLELRISLSSITTSKKLYILAWSYHCNCLIVCNLKQAVQQDEAVDVVDFFFLSPPRPVIPETETRPRRLWFCPSQRILRVMAEI